MNRGSKFPSLLTVLGLTIAALGCAPQAHAQVASLTWNAQPGNSPTNQPLRTATAGSLQVTAKDAGMAAVSGVTINITLTTGSGALSGTTSAVTNGSGIAIFNNLKIDTAGAGDQLTATEPTSMVSQTSSTFNVLTVATLTWSQQPSGTTAVNSAMIGAMGGSPQVTARDGSNAAVPNAVVVISIGTNPATNPAGTLSGVVAANTNASGVATFVNLRINRDGTGYTLVASSATAPSGNVTATSAAFNITGSGAASKLLFTGQPAAATPANTNFSVTVSVVDANNNVVTGDSSTITLTKTGTGPGTLSSASGLSQAATAGVLTVSDLRIDTDSNAQGDDTIHAADGALTAATSTAFTIDSVGPACVGTITVTNAPTHKTVNVSYQDTLSGLSTLVVLGGGAPMGETPVNLMGSTVGAFTVGTTSSVPVTLTKNDDTMTASATVQATDVAGNGISSSCASLSSLFIQNGQPARRRLTDVVRSQGQLYVANGAAGLDSVDIAVNGQLFQITDLKANELRRVDVTAAMLPGNQPNDVSLTGFGPTGANALVLGTDHPVVLMDRDLGDVNGDGKINVADVVRILRAITDGDPLTSNEARAADLNGDGMVTVADVTLLLQKVVVR